MNTQNNIVQAFSTFYNTFITEQQSLLQELIVAMQPENLSQNHNNIIEQVLLNYHNYYEMKSNATRNDVYVFFSPPWLSSFERSLLWLSEFKPSLIIRILNSAVTDLTAEQTATIDELKAETRVKERELNESMTMVQESVVSLPILNFARRFARQVVDGELTEIGVAMEAVEMAMVAVVDNADELRGRTILKVREVLSEVQMMRFLTATLEFQFRVRNYGMERDAPRNHDNGGR